MFDTIAIVGVGLIGGSIGMAAKKNKLAKRVIGLGRSEQKLMRAKILGAIDEYSLDMESGIAEADMIFLCTPVRTIVPLLENMKQHLKSGAIVTDVGSTKRVIVEDATNVLPEDVYFVGGHPMAGSEQTGVDAAFPDLFLGATYVVTPNESTDLNALGMLISFVEEMGARVETMTPEQHDCAVAVISHLPHAMASALLQTAESAQRKTGKVFRLAAGSFRDLTRISDSSPELWRDICLTNADSITDSITQFQGYLEEFKKALENRDAEAIEHYYELANDVRQTYLRFMK